MHKTPLSLPDFTGVQSENLISAMEQIERGNGDAVLQQLEQELAALVGSREALAIHSATAGLHLALLALGVGEGDEVICPSFTFAASAFPVLYQKAIPVLVDSEKVTWNMSPHYLEQAIQDRKAKGKRLKAIIVVHSYGMPAQMDEIVELASYYKIPLIEDAANALGTSWKGRQVGGMGRIGVFSFNRNKIISGAGGGAIVTDDLEVAKKARYYAHQSRADLPYYWHEQVGYNYGLSPIVAEIIRLQLPLLQTRVAQRRSWFTTCCGELAPDAYSWQQERDGVICNRWISTFFLGDQHATKPSFVNWEKRRTVWKPLHTQPVFAAMPYFGGKESELLFERAFCIPFSKAE